MSLSNRRLLYLLFFVSGFCSLVYQVVWTRLAFAAFGIITPVLSVVLSVFMLGLAVGSWGGGQLIGRLTARTGRSAILFYGGAELMIGIGAFAAPALFALGQHLLLAAGEMNSFGYLSLSALVLAASILPWCICMGATFPCMMAYVREKDAANTDSFSYLYYANVLGAMTGTIMTAVVLIEIMGFHRTLLVAAAGNFFIAALSACLGFKKPRVSAAPRPVTKQASLPTVPASDAASGNLIRLILFTTGFCAMAMEVVWTRAFTPVLKTHVYAFAFIVFTYLAATFLGSMLYRRHLRRNALLSLGTLMALLGLALFLPIIALDPRLLPTVEIAGRYADRWNAALLVLASICPICFVLGYLTPSLIDRYAAGHPATAGKAYGINVIGCILGPLCASYLMLPFMSEGCAMILLGLPLLGLGFLCRDSLPPYQRVLAAALVGLAMLWSIFFSQGYEDLLRRCEAGTTVRRDYAASVTSLGTGFDRVLLVNGVGMTTLCLDTKLMIHLPMALHQGPPRSLLIICFGMGTSFRSGLSWGVPTTVVELVPGVVKAFGYYHDDTAKALADPNARIVIDDGRRFLQRTREKFDVIVVDPPPPLEAAGSSLLFSREFYDLARQHLNTNGILQMWCPTGNKATVLAVCRTFLESFPYKRTFGGCTGFGTHLIGSMQPIMDATTPELLAQMPPAAKVDLMEWTYHWNLRGFANPLELVVSSRVQVDNWETVINPVFQVTDDRPFNEYLILRSLNLYKP